MSLDIPSTFNIPSDVMGSMIAASEAGFTPFSNPYDWHLCATELFLDSGSAFVHERFYLTASPHLVVRDPSLSLVTLVTRAMWITPEQYASEILPFSVFDIYCNDSSGLEFIRTQLSVPSDLFASPLEVYLVDSFFADLSRTFYPRT
jgi:hypothetical protein